VGAGKRCEFGSEKKTSTRPPQNKANRASGEAPYARWPLFCNPVKPGGAGNVLMATMEDGGPTGRIRLYPRLAVSTLIPGGGDSNLSRKEYLSCPRRGIRLYPRLPTRTLTPAGACVGSLGGTQTLSPPGSGLYPFAGGPMHASLGSARIGG
jgi:hypothetical protein